MKKIISKIKKYLYVKKEFIKKISFNSGKYWEKRYYLWWNSWEGSYNKNAEYKATILNNIIKEYNISNLIEFWCWDGNNLKYYNIQNYTWFDVSETAIKICIEKYINDSNKTFIYYIPGLFKAWWLKLELVISFEVIFHLIEDEVYEKYINDLFNSSKKYVLILSTNKKDKSSNASHYKDRIFTNDIPKNFKLIKKIDSVVETLWSDFFLYEKILQ